jgi:adenine-specific DNA-methyltransferase
VRSAETREVTVDYDIRNRDFVAHASHVIEGDLFGGTQRVIHVVTNPPYRQVASDSAHRALLRPVGIEATNLYSGFVGLALKLLTRDGNFVA